MESTQNVSKISAVFGENPEGKEKINITVNANLTKHAAQSQLEKLAGLTQASDLEASLVISFRAVSGHRESLAKHIHEIFEGKVGSKMSTDLNGLVQTGLITYHVSEVEDRVTIVVRPGGEVASTLHEQIQGILGLGLEELVQNQENAVTASISSARGFAELDADVKGGVTFLSTLLKSLKAQVVLNLHQNIVSNVMQIVSNLGLCGDGCGVFGLLKLFKNLDLDLKFASTDELPESIRGAVGKHAELRFGLTASPSLPENDRVSFKKLVEYIDNGVDVYVTEKQIGAIHLSLNGAGFGDHFTSRIKA